MSSRIPAARWASPSTPQVPVVDVLIPTADRPTELAVTLAGLAAQDDPPFRVVVSDQSDPVGRDDAAGHAAVAAMCRVLAAQGRPVRITHHLPRRGMAEQRQFLLEQASARAVLFLDDDVWLEPGALVVLWRALRHLGCGMVGMAVQGLSHLGDVRPSEQAPFQAWDGPVTPETVDRHSTAFRRWTLHNAANLAHIAAAHGLSAGRWLPYRVAWIGGCVLYDRAALLEAGGFGFWRELPVRHAGEDVVAQWRVMRRFGGAGILPSSAVHLQVPTTLPDRPVDAPDIIA